MSAGRRRPRAAAAHRKTTMPGSRPRNSHSAPRPRSWPGAESQCQDILPPNLPGRRDHLEAAFGGRHPRSALGLHGPPQPVQHLPGLVRGERRLALGAPVEVVEEPLQVRQPTVQRVAARLNPEVLQIGTGSRRLPLHRTVRPGQNRATPPPARRVTRSGGQAAGADERHQIVECDASGIPRSSTSQASQYRVRQQAVADLLALPYRACGRARVKGAFEPSSPQVETVNHVLKRRQPGRGRTVAVGTLILVSSGMAAIKDQAR
jgi:hypothetical protein